MLSGDIRERWPNPKVRTSDPAGLADPVIFVIGKNGRVALRRMDNVGIVVESLDAAISFSPSWASNSKGER